MDTRTVIVTNRTAGGVWLASTSMHPPASPPPEQPSPPRVPLGRGFTLIELMIVLVILGVLAGLAYAGYQEVVTRSNRSDAREALAAVQLAQERLRGQTGQYSNDFAALGLASPPGPVAQIESTRGFYDIAITEPTVAAPSRSVFVATATPKGRQARDTGCNPIQLRVTAGGEVRTPANCW